MLPQARSVPDAGFKRALANDIRFAHQCSAGWTSCRRWEKA
jgi:hypothetical protein